MKLRIEQLDQHLQKQLATLYVISGDEPLLLQESCDAIIQAAKQQQISERRIFTVESGFNWQSLLEANQSLSLFSNRQLFDLRIINGKPGKEGSDVLKKYVEVANPDNILMIRLPKLDGASTRSKWYTTLEKVGVAIQVWPLKAEQYGSWIRQRAQLLQLKLNANAIHLLAEHTLGNLMAAQQTLIKLQLLYDTLPIDEHAIVSVMSDHSRFNVFELVDAALKGDRKQVCHILNVLKGEGIEPTIILWALAREIRLLAEISFELQHGGHFAELTKQHKIWQNRQALVRTACQRQPTSYWQNCLNMAHNIDRLLKGASLGNPWYALLDLSVRLTGQPLMDVA